MLKEEVQFKKSQEKLQCKIFQVVSQQQLYNKPYNRLSRAKTLSLIKSIVKDPKAVSRRVLLIKWAIRITILFSNNYKNPKSELLYK